MPVIAIASCRKLEDYRQSVLHVGGEVRIVDPSMTAEEAFLGVHGLMLTGGDDVAPSRYGEPPHPSFVEAESGRDEFELALVGRARAANLPILAICRGVQWHPENFFRTGEFRPLFEGFLEAADRA